MVILKNESDGLVTIVCEAICRHLCGFFAAQTKSASSSSLQRTQNVEQCALTTARWTRNGHRLAGFHLERDIPQYDQGLGGSRVLFSQPFYDQ